MLPNSVKLDELYGFDLHRPGVLAEVMTPYATVPCLFLILAAELQFISMNMKLSITPR